MKHHQTTLVLACCNIRYGIYLPFSSDERNHNFIISESFGSQELRLIPEAILSHYFMAKSNSLLLFMDNSSIQYTVYRSKRLVLAILESARETRRLLAIMCIGFLANHRLCNHSLNQLVCVYQCLFYQCIFVTPNTLFGSLIFFKQF